MRSDVLTGKDTTTTSVAGQPLVPLIVYPGRKLQYIEPIIYLLRELEQQIKKIKYIFVIGYSFKDEHLARMLRYAARKNRELIVFLIGPSASVIYNQILKYHNDEEFLKSFTKSFSPKSFSSPVQSDLCGRVICLNYKFKQIFPFLKDGYLRNLIEAEKLENKAGYEGSETEKSNWKNQLRHYIVCEHMDRVDEKINETGWNKIVSDDWRFAYEISFKGLLTSLISDDTIIKNKWSKFFEEVNKIFSINQFIYQPSPGGPYASFSSHIKLELRNTYGNITSSDLATYLKETAIPVIQQKLRIASDNKYTKINEFLDRINSLNDYLHLWHGESMTFSAYYLKRSQDHSDKIENLRKKVDQFLEFPENETRQQEVRNLIKDIETIELLKIYGANTLKGDFSLLRLMGYLSMHRQKT